MGKYTAEQIEKSFQEMTKVATAHCTLTTELVGGQPADEKGVAMFVEHHLHLVGSKAEEAVKRILKEEVGERDTTPEGGELEDNLSYGINVVRHDDFGPWLGAWMQKSCLKAAASRLALFTSKKGAKGDMAEMGRVQAIGASLSGDPTHIHFVDENGYPAQTYYKTFRGSVQSPQGRKSIVGDRECVPVGAQFSFEFRLYDGKITEADLVKIFAAASNIGVGSCKAFECGKFRIDSLEVE